MERQKNTLTPFFSPPYVVSCGTQGEDTVCLEECRGNMSSRNDVYEHSDLNETPGWEGGRHESGNLRPGWSCRGNSYSLITCGWGICEQVRITQHLLLAFIHLGKKPGAGGL